MTQSQNPMLDTNLISIVIPAYNEQEVIDEFYRRIAKVLDGLSYRSELVFVNDGSTDDTIKKLRALKKQDGRVGIVELSRNFGKEIALTAGIDHAKGEAVIPIDADLQDPPELIPELLAQWEAGNDVVYATRLEREGETWIKKATASTFYKLMQNIGDKVSIPRNTGDFRLMSRRAVTAFCSMREQHRFLKGLFALVGFPQTAVYYNRDPRFAGLTKWNYPKLINLSIEGITSFTTAPLRLATYAGFVIAICAFTYAAFIIYKTLVFGDPVAGYPSLMTVVLFLGGVQLLSIGVIGEYLGRVFNETKQRPLYFVQGFDEPVS
ncbi:MAG: glycosyltransferase family 2 protein [Pseudomonadota bacterium]